VFYLNTVHTIRNNTEAVVVASRVSGLEVMLINLSTRLCHEIRIRDEVII